MALQRRKVLFITTGVITLIVFAGILALLLNVKAFKSQVEAAASDALGMDLQIKGGIAEARDVALASRNERVAMKGRLNFLNKLFVDVTVAVLDERGCTVYSEKVHGSFHEPQIEKKSIFKSLAGPVLTPLKDAWKFIQ